MSSRVLNISGGLTVAIVLALAVTIAIYARSPRPVEPSGSVPYGGPFTMMDGHGRTVTERDFRGRPLAVFFGFTSCPDVCPTTLIDMADLMARLGPDADRLTAIFVTIDPERDTAAIMRDYVDAFDARMVGLSGTMEQVTAMAKGWGVYFRKAPTAGGSYMVDHTASVFLINRNGGLQSTLDLHDKTPGVNLAKLRVILR